MNELEWNLYLGPVFCLLLGKMHGKDTMYFFFLIFKCLFLRERMRVHKWGRDREGGRHRICRRLQALSCQHRARCRPPTCQLWDHDLSKVGHLTDWATQAPPGYYVLLRHWLSLGSWLPGFWKEFSMKESDKFQRTNLCMFLLGKF